MSDKTHKSYYYLKIDFMPVYRATTRTFIPTSYCYYNKFFLHNFHNLILYEGRD